MPDISIMGKQPPAAAAAGYHTQTLGPQGFTDTSKWRNFTFFGWTPSGVINNADGSVTLHNNNKTGTQSGNAGIATAWPASGTTPGAAGNGFSGGAYIECVMRLSNAWSGSGASGWPSFWSLPMEQTTSTGVYSIHWPGQAGTTDGTNSSYNHSCEPDFYEYNPGNPAKFGSALHDYFNTPPSRQTTNAAMGSPITLPGGTDPTQFHKYGWLWIPATSAPSNGSAQMYVDDVAVGSKAQWVLNNDAGQSPPVVVYPTTGPQAGSIMDTKHIYIILGNSSKDDSGIQMIVREVNVWQKDDSKNWHF